MRPLLLCLCLALAGGAAALPLSSQGEQEAQLFNDYLQAVYAQRAGDPQRFELLQRVLAQAPDSAYIKQQLVAEALAADTPKLAQAYIDFIDNAQDDPEAWAIYATYEWQTDHPKEALAAYEKAVELDPDNELILFQYITMLSALDPQQAEEELTQLANTRPVIAPDIYTEIGKIYLYHQRYSKALEAFNHAAQLDTNDPQPRLGRASVYERTNQYFLMLHELEELEKMGYVTPQTLTQMASVFVIVKDFPRAEQYYLRAKELENDNLAANYFLALLAEEAGDYPRAITYLKDSADYDASAQKQVQVSFYQRKLGQNEASLQTLKSAYEQFEDQSKVAYFYALALYEDEQYKKSARVLAPWVEKEPDDFNLRLQYAFALEGLKDFSAMEEQLDILLEQDPQHGGVLNLYAFSLAQRGERLDVAADYIARALAQEPDNYSYIDTQAWVFFKQGKTEQAADVMRAIPDEILAENPEIAYHAAYIYAAQNDEPNLVHVFHLGCGKQPVKTCLKEMQRYF